MTTNVDQDFDPDQVRDMLANSTLSPGLVMSLLKAALDHIDRLNRAS